MRTNYISYNLYRNNVQILIHLYLIRNSRNNFLLALITMGEGWHNNHHYYPASTRQGFYWWEIDMTYYCLKAMELVGLVWDIKDVPIYVREGKSKHEAVAV